MTTKAFHIKVYPSSSINIKKCSQKVNSNYLCPCRILKFCIIPMRLIGRFPFSWQHVNGKCRYEMSTFWMIYSCILMAGVALSSTFIMPSLKFSITNVPVFLDSITNLFSIAYWSLAILYLGNIHLWIGITKRLIKVSKDHLFCPKSKKTTIQFQKSLLILVASVFIFQNIAFVFFKYFATHELPFQILFFRNMNIMPSINYIFWFSCIQYCSSLFICFENVVCNYLGYEPMHPEGSIDLTHNEYQFNAFAKPKKMCFEKHLMPDHLLKLTRVEIIEYLRISHEEIYEIVLLLQEFTSPQLLACIVLEVSILIVNIYSLMVYMIYNFDTMMAKSKILLNAIYVFSHFTGFFWFFKNINDLMKIVRELKPILTACVLSAQSNEEHQQFRIFINKVASQRPFSINDFFNADLSVMGPVIGSIITYLLVALQVEIPPQEYI